MILANKRKFKWEIKIEENYMGTGKTYLAIDLNGGLNSAIPLESEGVEGFKREKLAEIKVFEGENLDHIKGIDLLGYSPMYVRQLGYSLDDKRFSICGYKGSKIMIQVPDINLEVKKLKLYDNSKGRYFNYEGKRIYVNEIN